MIQRLFLLLLVCLLLAGCAPESAPNETTAPPPETTAAPTPPTVPPETTAPQETEPAGPVRSFPLDIPVAGGVVPMGTDLLVFSSAEDGTVLTVLTGDSLSPAASCRLSFSLTPQNPSLDVSPEGLCFYYEQGRRMVAMDTDLKEINHIPVPEDMIGTPVLSADRNTLYYCTADSIRAWDLTTGIRRLLKEVRYQMQSVTGLWMEDTVLQCRVSEDSGEAKSLFLSTETGRTLYLADSEIDLVTAGQRYYAVVPVGAANSLIYGQAGESPMELEVQDLSTSCFFLPQSHGAVTIVPGNSGSYGLNYYDLAAGKCTASLPLPEGFSPWQVTEAAPGIIYVLVWEEQTGKDFLYRWDTAMLPVSDNTVYTDIHHTQENPDYSGLAECQLYADEISSRYGIEVLIYRDATTLQPWDYDMETEYTVSIIWRQLELLDSRLANYPAGMLAALSEHFGSLRICIVRSLLGSAGSGSLEAAAGIQFFGEQGASIALAADQDTEYALYHELCHLIDTYVITHTNAYDNWENLNPDGFSYDYDYTANAQRDSGAYLTDSNRYFIDTYSMSYPKEDRARIMEYAMTPGNTRYFQSSAMQAKLQRLCQGIREAFGMTKIPESFLWEQYLKNT